MEQYISKRPYEDFQRVRDEIIHTTIEDIRHLAEPIKVVLDSQNLCVIGGEQAMEEAKELFHELKPLA